MRSDLPIEFKQRIEAARLCADRAREQGDRETLVKELKELANILRRVPELRREANRIYEEIVELDLEMGLPLEAAWATRHIGINYEYAGDLEEAERCYDRSLEIFREHAEENSLDYANAVRYPAVIKDRLGDRVASAALWQEACDRYEQVELPIGVAEAAARLTGFALDDGNLDAARQLLDKASVAAAAAADSDTDIMMDELRARYAGVASLA